jgi:hypothetical protein
MFVAGVVGAPPPEVGGAPFDPYRAWYLCRARELCMHCAAHISPWTIESQASQRILLWDISLWTTKSLRTNSFVGYSTVDY